MFRQSAVGPTLGLKVDDDNRFVLKSLELVNSGKSVNPSLSTGTLRMEYSSNRRISFAISAGASETDESKSSKEERFVTKPGAQPPTSKGSTICRDPTAIDAATDDKQVKA